MTKICIVLALFAAACSTSVPTLAPTAGDDQALTDISTLRYVLDEGWLKLRPGQETLGNTHGEIAIAGNGDVYISVNSDEGGLHVFNEDGQFLRRIADLPWDSHDFLLHPDTDGREFLYGASVWGQKFYKATLEGETVLTITAESVPAQFRAQADGSLYMTMSGVAIAPNGDIYIVDGYGKDYIHQFTSEGAYIRTFGGRDDPWNFENCHKISIDPRFSQKRLLCTDRANGRLVHLALNGQFIGVHADHLRRPSAVSFYGDRMAVAEIAGRVSVLDKKGTTLLTLGTNEVDGEINTNETPPDRWRTGVFTSPHGIAFDADGRLYVSEWNKWGRVLRFRPN